MLSVEQHTDRRTRRGVLHGLHADRGRQPRERQRPSRARVWHRDLGQIGEVWVMRCDLGQADTVQWV